MPEYNPDSTDAVLSRIETTLNAHVNDTKNYRMSNDMRLTLVLDRVTELEGDKKKLLGLAIGSGIGAGGVGSILARLLH